MEVLTSKFSKTDATSRNKLFRLYQIIYERAELNFVMRMLR